jgi:hypothetical protein
MVGLKVFTCVRTTNMGTHFCEWYCFLACTRPPDCRCTTTLTTLTIKITEYVQPTDDCFIVVSYLYCTVLRLIYWCNGSIMNTDYSVYVQEHIYWFDSAVSCKTSFDSFFISSRFVEIVTSPMSGNIHQQDYFIFLGFQVLHRDLEPIFLKRTVGTWSTYW